MTTILTTKHLPLTTVDYQIPPQAKSPRQSETPCKPLICKGFLGALGATRTRGLQSRSLTLYPTELRAHAFLLERVIIIARGFTGVKQNIAFRSYPRSYQTRSSQLALPFAQNRLYFIRKRFRAFVTAAKNLCLQPNRLYAIIRIVFSRFPGNDLRSALSHFRSAAVQDRRLPFGAAYLHPGVPQEGKRALRP